ncbi:hypothetical protein K466DRAFT_606107 [Polyporus arcularius HHB13444]|uniref:Uncharacterized protein n=1 Tax=Polyporus arcularius HHB13444 TaxID=1314778 RepID=A0A5C3NQ57_9APHY|nr:hypothetical protein K466DRAFT_606107 [Polyporus arcularius HHB13444]
MLCATALLLRHHALGARLHLRSLLHLQQPLRAQPDAPPRTSEQTHTAVSNRILHSLGSTSPARSTCLQGPLNDRALEHRNLVPQQLRITLQSPASTPEPEEREHTPPTTLLRRTLSRLHQLTPSLPMSLRTVLQPLHPLLRHRTMNSTS